MGLYLWNNEGNETFMKKTFLKKKPPGIPCGFFLSHILISSQSEGELVDLLYVGQV